MGSLKMSPTTSEDTRPHVCIVGTGISGLRCAARLLEHGFRVTMLEARNRIGGRVGRVSMQAAPVLAAKTDEAPVDMPE